MLRADGEVGAERGVSEDEVALARAGAAHGWAFADNRRGESPAALHNADVYCEFPLRSATGSATHDGCRLYGPNDKGDGRPSCADVSVFGDASAAYKYDCAGETDYRDGVCACPADTEAFDFKGAPLCARENEKFMLDLCISNGWQVQNLGGGVASLACVIERQ